MDRSIELIPLVCLRCSTSIPAEPEEVAWVCAQCGQGMHLDQNNGLQPLEVSFSAAILPGKTGRPFWVTRATVSLARQTYGSGDRQLHESEEFWRIPRTFFVPAFTTTLENLLDQAAGHLLKPPDLIPGPAAPFEPVTLQLEDVQAGVEFIVVAVEAGRKDRLKKLDLNLQITPPSLWILP